MGKQPQKKPPQHPYPGSERFGVGLEDIMPVEPGAQLEFPEGAIMQTGGEKPPEKQPTGEE